MYKYSLTLHDLSGEDVQTVLDTFNADPEATQQPAELAVAAGIPPVGSPAPATAPVATPAQATVAAAIEAELIPSAPVAAPAQVAVKEETHWVNENDAELDKSGIPWDERVHSSSKKQTVKGVWSKRKNLEAGVFDAVTAELKRVETTKVMLKTVPGVDPGEVVGLDVPAFMERNNLVPPPTAPVADVVPPLPAPDTAPVAPTRDFNGFMQQIQNLFAAGDIDEAYMTTNVVGRINADFTDKPDIVGMTDIANDEAMVDYAWKCLEADKKIGVA